MVGLWILELYNHKRRNSANASLEVPSKLPWKSFLNAIWQIISHVCIHILLFDFKVYDWGLRVQSLQCQVLVAYLITMTTLRFKVLLARHLYWIEMTHVNAHSSATQVITQCLLWTLKMTQIADGFAIGARAHVCIWILFSPEASNDRMFVFVDHYGINPTPPLPNGRAVAHTNTPIHLKTSCNYSKWGG